MQMLSVNTNYVAAVLLGPATPPAVPWNAPVGSMTAAAVTCWSRASWPSADTTFSCRSARSPLQHCCSRDTSCGVCSNRNKVGINSGVSAGVVAPELVARLQCCSRDSSCASAATEEAGIQQQQRDLH
jgi:hypothetical protein